MRLCRRERFKRSVVPEPESREQRIAELDRFVLWNYWLIEDGEHPSVDSARVREKIDRLLDARLILMKQVGA
jgi:hypothetical protein